MRLRFLLIFLLGLLPSAFIFAVAPSSILVDVSPANPAPNENVSITLSSYTSNLDSVRIEWGVNGKTTLSGIGKKTYSLKAGGEGSSTTVEIRIMLPDGEIDKRVVIAPQVMTLLWQTNDSYVPPFYRGKAFPVPESPIKVVAIPEAKNSNGTNNSSNMVYDWTMNYENVPEGSGYGKNSFTYTSDYLDDSNLISVSASTPEQTYSSEASVTITSGEPKLVFYKKDNALGTIWENALPDGHQISGDEIIVAEPYFVTPKNLRVPVFTWNWSINGNTVTNQGFLKNNLPVKVPAGTRGTSVIRLDLSNIDKIFQKVSKELNVEF
jgi:hypothetical protein